MEFYQKKLYNYDKFPGCQLILINLFIILYWCTADHRKIIASGAERSAGHEYN